MVCFNSGRGCSSRLRSIKDVEIIGIVKNEAYESGAVKICSEDEPAEWDSPSTFLIQEGQGCYVVGKKEMMVIICVCPICDMYKPLVLSREDHFAPKSLIDQLGEKDFLHIEASSD